MSSYRLRCTYARATGNWAPIIGAHTIEAETDAEAIETARSVSKPAVGLVLSTAVLIDAAGRFVWSAPHNPDAERPDGMPQGSGI